MANDNFDSVQGYLNEMLGDNCDERLLDMGLDDDDYDDDMPAADDGVKPTSTTADVDASKISPPVTLSTINTSTHSATTTTSTTNMNVSIQHTISQVREALDESESEAAALSFGLNDKDTDTCENDVLNDDETRMDVIRTPIKSQPATTTQPAQRMMIHNNVHNNRGPLSPFSPMLNNMSRQQRKKRRSPGVQKVEWTSGATTEQQQNDQLSLAPCRKVSTLLRIIPPMYCNEYKHKQHKQKMKICLFPLNHHDGNQQQQQQDDQPSSSSLSSSPPPSSPITATMNQASAEQTKDMVIVNPSAFGKYIPAEITLETARLVAQVSNIESEDWARRYKFDNVLWPSTCKNSNNTNNDSNKALIHLAHAFANDAFPTNNNSSNGGGAVCVGVGGPGTGKTYTLLGSKATTPNTTNGTLSCENSILHEFGLLGLTLHLLWEHSAHQQSNTSVPSEAASASCMTISFLEVVDEDTLRDLLATNYDPYSPQNQSHLRIRHVDHRGAIVQNLSQRPVDSLQDLEKYIKQAFHSNSAQRARKREGSRGHVIVTVEVLREFNSGENSNHVNQTSCTVLRFIDLANGDMTSAPTSTSNSSSILSSPPPPLFTATEQRRLARRSQSIRKSISGLKGVLRGLMVQQDLEKPITFRECTLTKLLQRSLETPDVRAVIIGTVSPTADSYRRTLQTLDYVHRLLIRPGQTAESPYHSTTTLTTTTVTSNNGASPSPDRVHTPMVVDEFPNDKALLEMIITDPRQRLAKITTPKKPSLDLAPKGKILDDDDDHYQPYDYMQIDPRIINKIMSGPTKEYNSKNAAMQSPSYDNSNTNARRPADMEPIQRKLWSNDGNTSMKNGNKSSRAEHKNVDDKPYNEGANQGKDIPAPQAYPDEETAESNEPYVPNAPTRTHAFAKVLGDSKHTPPPQFRSSVPPGDVFQERVGTNSSHNPLLQDYEDHESAGPEELLHMYHGGDTESFPDKDEAWPNIPNDINGHRDRIIDTAHDLFQPQEQLDGSIQYPPAQVQDPTTEEAFVALKLVGHEIPTNDVDTDNEDPRRDPSISDSLPPELSYEIGELSHELDFDLRDEVVMNRGREATFIESIRTNHNRIRKEVTVVNQTQEFADDPSSRANKVGKNPEEMDEIVAIDEMKKQHTGLWQTSSTSLERLRDALLSNQLLLREAVLARQKTEKEAAATLKQLMRQRNEHIQALKSCKGEISELKANASQALDDKNAIERIAEAAIAAQDKQEQEISTLKGAVETIRQRAEEATLRWEESLQSNEGFLEEARELRQQLSDMHAKNNELEATNERLQHSLSFVESDKNVLAEMHENAQRKLQEFESKQKDAVEQLNSYKKEINILNSKNEEITSTLAQNENQAELLAEKDLKLAKITTELETLRSQLDTNLKRTNKEAAALKQSKITLQNEQSRLVMQVTGLKVQLQEYESRILVAEEAKDSALADLLKASEASRDVTRLAAELRKLRLEREKDKKRFSSLQEQNEQLKLDSRSASDRNEESNGMLKRALEENKSQQETNIMLQQSIERIRKERDSNYDGLNALKERIEVESLQRKNVEGDNSLLKSKLEKSILALERFREEVQNIRSTAVSSATSEKEFLMQELEAEKNNSTMIRLQLESELRAAKASQGTGFDSGQLRELQDENSVLRSLVTSAGKSLNLGIDGEKISSETYCLERNRRIKAEEVVAAVAARAKEGIELRNEEIMKLKLRLSSIMDEKECEISRLRSKLHELEKYQGEYTMQFATQQTRRPYRSGHS